jgi:hypothetical protein
VRDDHLVRVRHHRDRLETPDRVIGLLGVQSRVDHVRGAHREERVAVRGRRRDDLRADEATGAGLVLDHHRLAEVLGHLLADGAGERIAGSRGGQRDDELDRLAGILLRLREGNGGACERREDAG